MDWLAARDIVWLPVLLRVDDDGKKNFLVNEMKRLLGYVPRTDMFGKDDKISWRQQQFKNGLENYLVDAKELGAFWVLALDTTDVFVMDVDDGDALPFVENLMKTTPYYFSTTKKLPKIFLMDSKMATADVMNIGNSHFDLHNNNLKFFEGKIELQKGLWSYLPLDQPILNDDKLIVDFDIEDWLNSYPTDQHSPSSSFLSNQQPLKSIEIKTDDDIVPLSFYEHHISFKLIQCLSTHRANDFKSWFDVACALKSSGFAYSFHIWRLFSKCSPKYNDEYFELGGRDRKLWDNIVPRRTLGSLHFWAKQDNPDLYLQMVGNSYSVVKEREESKLFKLLRPVCFGVEDAKGVQLLTKDKLNVRYEDVFYTNEDGVKVPFLKRWLKDPEKRCYDEMTFQPNIEECPDNVFNTFTPFPVHFLVAPTYNSQMVEEVLDYLEKRLCGGDKKFTDWFLRWLAQFVKEPWNKTRMAVVIKGVEGGGKGLFIMFLKLMIHYVCSDEGEPDKFLGKFNSAVMNLLLLCFDEAGAEQLFPKKSKLKALITNDTLPIEHKGVDVIPDYPNYVNVIFTTNNDFPVPVDYSDRRYACVESSAPKLTATEIKYYNSLFHNKDCMYSFYKYLCGIDTSSSLLETRVLTNFYKECKRRNVDIYTLFFYHFIQQNVKQDEWEKPVFYFRSPLYEKFKQWFNDYNKKDYCVPDINKFWLKLLKINGLEKRVKRVGDWKDDRKVSGVQFIPKNVVDYFVQNNLIEDVDEIEEVGDDVICHGI